MIEYEEIKPNENQIKELIELSEIWEKENITFGYRKNSIEDITDKRVFIVKENQKIIGFIFEKDGISKNYNSIMKDGQKYFGIEEIYVIPSKKSLGIGKNLMNYAKNMAKQEGYEYIFLVTSTKNSKEILDFYINKCDMTFYCASLVEKLS